MIKTEKIIGLEIANSSIKLVYGPGDKDEFTYLNTHEEIEHSKINDELRINFDNVFEFKGKKYKVGLPNTLGSGGISEMRYESEEFKMECAFAIAQIVKTPYEYIKVVTGVPAAEYENDKLIDKIKKNLIGDYAIYYQDTRRTFNIQDVIILPQPIGTLLDTFYTKDLKEKIKESDMYNDYLIFDVGFGTSDFCVANLENGVRDVKTIYEGMLKVTANIIKGINTKYPEYNVYRYVKSPHQLDKQLQNSCKVVIGNKKLDISDIVEEEHQKFVKSLYDGLLNMNYDLASYYKIIMTGGGSIALEKALRKQFEKECSLEFVKEPVKANARGFYILGKQNF